MSLLILRKLVLSYGGPLLLDGVDLVVEPGERLCLMGRNGTGKSTLMKVIAGEIQADDGEVQRSPDLKVTRLTQEVPQDIDGKVFDVVAGGVGELGGLIGRYHQASLRLARGEDALAELAEVQQQLEAAGGWSLERRVESVISRLGLDGELPFESLSGGLKRRVLLGRALAGEPDLLLLDEPTNHLDIDAILWLEEFLLDFSGTLLFVTHDRAFLRRLATRIIELDRGKLLSWPGDYDTYLRRRQEYLDAEATRNAEFDKKLAQEEVWIRKGVEARRTRNEGRVRALKAMREDRRQRRELQGKAEFSINEAERSGKLVVEAENVCFAWAGPMVIRDFSATILRGDKVGIIGPNGAGKSTLLKLLLGELQPQSGRIRAGTKLEPVYFDQYRSQLDDEASVFDNVADGNDRVSIGSESRHVIGYLQEFLFTPDRVRTPVKALSGGERNRLLLAKLFTKPSNLLVLDEPTNDLDAETLDLLEERLVAYPGTVLLVSHDRSFLDDVATSTLVFEGEGRVNEYVGGYTDWLRQRAVEAPPQPRKAKEDKREKARAERPRKLGFKEQRELEALPGRIEELEAAIALIQEEMASPTFYQQTADAMASAMGRLEAMEGELPGLYARWEELDALAAG